jgi:hypothetical protein
MGNISDTIRREAQKTHFVLSNFFFKRRAVYEIMPKNFVEPDRPHVSIIRFMRFPCWVTKAGDVHLEYLILIAFPLRQWLRQRA